jgi:hypothetical protein
MKRSEVVNKLLDILEEAVGHPIEEINVNWLASELEPLIGKYEDDINNEEYISLRSFE